jgi:hypothetical protein
MKMPEPIRRDDTEHNVDYFTTEQLKQYGRDLLDMVLDEIKVESDYSGTNRRMHLQSLLPSNNCEAKMVLLKLAVENAQAPCDTCINFEKENERHLYKESCATCCHFYGSGYVQAAAIGEGMNGD